MRCFQLFLFSAVVLGLASCGNPEASKPGAPVVQASVTTETSASGFKALQEVTDKTTAAVGADKFDQAKTEFEKFEASWKIVEDGVKAKSPDTYKAIEESLDTVKGEFKNKLPDKTKVLAALQSLSQSLKTAAKP